MAGKRTGRKKTAKKRKKGMGGGRSLGRLALLMAAAAVVFLALARFAGTPRGRVFLLDLGLDRYYEQVQSDIGVLLEKGAVEAGMPEEEMNFSTAAEAGQPGPVVVVKGDLPGGRSLLQLNVAVTRALAGSGGRVRGCVEKGKGRIIEMEIGTRRTVTHRCTFRATAKKIEKKAAGPQAPAITVIVDDFGYSDGRLVRNFLALEVPFTVSVIPGLKYSERICRQAREAGKEVICHLPMEPEEDADDRGGIPLVRTGMSGAEIEKMVGKALESTPGVIGMNNHMGSKATADMRVMVPVMKVCRRRKLFFIDSCTTPKSVVAAAAAKVGVKTLRNDFFLDNRGEDVRENMRKAISIALRRGRVTVIMHARGGNADNLEWLAGEARKKGVNLIRVSEMLGA